MANINTDTQKLRECGNSLMVLSNDLGENLEEMFTRIINVPLKTYEWVGESANRFSKITNAEKQNYINLKNQIYLYGKYLLETAENIEKAIDKNKVGVERVKLNFKNTELNSKIKPSISLTNQTLDKIVNLSNTLVIPLGFEQYAVLKNLDEFIAEIKKDLNNVSLLIENSNKDFDDAILETVDKLNQIEEIVNQKKNKTS